MDPSDISSMLAGLTSPGGEAQPPAVTDPSDLGLRYTAFKATPEEIAMGADFFVFDSTTQSEKGFLAQNLQQLLEVILSNPQAALMLDVDPKTLLDEIQQLRGSGPMKRFNIESSDDQMMKQQLQNALNPPPPAPPPPKTLAEALSMKLGDLSGNERTQALAQVGIQADPDAHDARMKLENPLPAPRAST